jgi:glycosyltransferase involved in cell wall biosynthesis
VGVLPFNEGVTLKSGTLLALFAHGLPMVATRPDPPEPALVDGRLVRLVERRDDAGISAVLSELLADAPQRARLGEAGRIYTRNLFLVRHSRASRAGVQSGAEERGKSIAVV